MLNTIDYQRERHETHDNKCSPEIAVHRDQYFICYDIDSGNWFENGRAPNFAFILFLSFTTPVSLFLSLSFFLVKSAFQMRCFIYARPHATITNTYGANPNSQTHLRSCIMFCGAHNLSTQYRIHVQLTAVQNANLLFKMRLLISTYHERIIITFLYWLHLSLSATDLFLLLTHLIFSHLTLIFSCTLSRFR